MIRNEYRERWAAWIPSALTALAMDPPRFQSVMPHMPLPELPAPALAPVRGPLRISLISSSGAYDRHTQAPFAAASIVGDPTHRVFETSLPGERIGFAHEHFDQASATADLECVIPRQAIQTCNAQLAHHIISWTGFLLDWPTFMEATIPQIVRQVQADGSNAAVIVPI